MKKILFLIFLFALIVRLIFILGFQQPPVSSDAKGYDELGMSLLEKKGFSFQGFPTVRREPVYPLFLSGIYLLFGHSYLAVRLIQSVIGALGVIFVFLIGKKVFSERCGYLAAIFYSLYPHFILTTGFLLTEALYIPLLLIAIFFIINCLERDKVVWYAVAGVFMGVVTLCRSITLFFPAFFFLMLLFLRNKKRALFCTFVFSIAMGLTILPWTIRNYIRSGYFVPIAIGGGSSFWTGSYIPWDGDWKYYDLTDFNKVTERLNKESALSEVEIDKGLYQEGLRNIRENPIGYINLYIKKIFRLWFWIPGGKEVLKGYPVVKIGLAIIQYAVIFLAVLGIVLARKMWKRFIPLVTIILYFTIIYCVFHAIPRYNLPIFPYLFVFVSAAILYINKDRSLV